MGEYNPAALAYLGDAVFELLVRERHIRTHRIKPGGLHEKTIKAVNAGAQAKIADKLLLLLNDDERAVYKRGRNASTHHAPKSASPADYCKATGLEAVFGYLYLNNETDRLNEIFKHCMEIADADGVI